MSDNHSTAELAREVARRRTFAIISHPDAGKTTLTEKLLLYGGAIDEAGSVRARKNQRRATSDYMAMEQSRGISINSTVLQFEYDGHCLNLLDTPGHQDFSEDTYRTLHAADSAIMVLDAAKGIEPQTRKLFHVCRNRGIPILGFINKMDQPSLDPFELLDQIEKELLIDVVAMNWPIGNGPDFQGVYDIGAKQVYQFVRAGNTRKAPANVSGIDDPALGSTIGASAWQELRESGEQLGVAGAEFDRSRFLDGNLVPVFFGSAVNNFGVEPFLRAILELAPPPTPKRTPDGAIEATHEEFTGFVFKIQANMDPRHRDRLAFLRVCSGRFEKDMEVFHPRLGRKVRMTRPHRLFARDRETVETAWPGDVIGFVNPGLFRIGDSVAESGDVRFNAIPRFSPEHFARLRPSRVDRRKQFEKGIQQLEEEGVVQLLYDADGRRSEPVLAVVGELQFDVLQARLREEYGVETTLQRLSYRMARWLSHGEPVPADIQYAGTSMLVEDGRGNRAILFSDKWELDYLLKNSVGLHLGETPPGN
ncbi:MAG: peptide chain release factor 3 [Thermoanaerobaculia bacterium]